MDYVEIAKNVVEKSIENGASQAEASVFMADSSLTRYTKNHIHQNVNSETYYINLLVVVGKNKLGSSAINSVDPKDAEKVIERAIKIAKVSTPDPEFVSLPESKPVQQLEGIYSKTTESITPIDRADTIKTILDTSNDYDKKVKWSAGSYETDLVHFAIANSLGIENYMKYTHGILEVNTRAGEDAIEGAGYRAVYVHDVSKINPVELAKSSAKDAVDSINPKTLDIGEYEAIFPPAAMSTFTGFMALLGFSAKSYQEGNNFLRDKIGSQVFDEKLNIIDDGRSLETYNASPFDGEGTPKQKLILVKDGIPMNLCYDNYYAKKDNLDSTGHALPKFSRGFFYRGVPIPVNQIIESKDSETQEMIEDTKKGVYITRLHYVNPIRHDLAVISGMTRDACWYIENGEIKYPIKVMRFTDSIPRMFKNVDMIGSDSTVNITSTLTSPTIKVSSFKFTGQSEF